MGGHIEFNIECAETREWFRLNALAIDADWCQVAPLATVIALAARHDYVEFLECFLERYGLADVAAQVVVRLVQIAIRIARGEIGGIGFDRAYAGEAELVDQHAAIRECFPEMLAGIEKDDWCRLVDL